MPHCRVTFISSLHNCLPLTQAMLASLEATVDFTDKQLVLIDDASSDGTASYLKTLVRREEITLLQNASNLGFAASNNFAAQAAKGEILVFINNDLELSENWLAPMLEALSSGTDAGAIGNVQRNFSSGLIDHAGIFFDLEGLPTHAHKNRRHPPRGSIIERNAVTAACLAIRKDVFESVGGFDESYRNGCEDVDLCMKLKQNGFRLYVALKSVVRHHVSVSPGRNDHNERNTEIFRKRWSSVTSQLGQIEWPREYFRKYARYWWRMNPQLALKALTMLLRRSA